MQTSNENQIQTQNNFQTPQRVFQVLREPPPIVRLSLDNIMSRLNLNDADDRSEIRNLMQSFNIVTGISPSGGGPD